MNLLFPDISGIKRKTGVEPVVIIWVQVGKQSRAYCVTFDSGEQRQFSVRL
jgi:hypothetical protein